MFQGTQLFQNSKVLSIFVHGFGRMGRQYGYEVSKTLRDILTQNKISNVFYLRNEYDFNPDKELSLEQEYDIFYKLFQDLMRDEKLQNIELIILIGHSYGGIISKYFMRQFVKQYKKITTFAISLDGSDLFTYIPYFLSQKLQKEVNISDLKFFPTYIKYKSQIISLSDNITYQNSYILNKPLKKDNYIIIDYNNSDKIGQTEILVKQITKFKDYYKWLYEIIVRNYSHTLHMRRDISKIIYERFIENIIRNNVKQ